MIDTSKTTKYFFPPSYVGEPGPGCGIPLVSLADYQSLEEERNWLVRAMQELNSQVDALRKENVSYINKILKGKD